MKIHKPPQMGTLRAVLITLCAMLAMIPARAATIQYNNTNYFLNGINLAWHRFGDDFGNGHYDPTFFETFFSNLESYHVNIARYWVHCGGGGAMNYDGSGAVTGLKSGYFNDFDDFLARAANHHVMVLLTLWSFDMCNNSQGPHTVLITDTTKTQSYINNALIPIVTRYATHPNIFAYEVINEPEGATSSYGWTDNRVSLSQIQSFVARIAAAIHQHCDKMVTVGSASLKYNSDVSPSVGNFWKNSALQAVYNSSDAYVDFYQIHFYDWMISGGWNPFDTSKPVSHWNLDKPCLVGEFYGQTDTQLNLTLPQLLNNDYANGYIGHMPWTYNSRWAGSKDPLKTFGDAHASIVDGQPAYSTVFYEAESLATYNNSGTLYTNNDSGLSGTHGIELDSTGTGNSVTFSVYVPVGGIPYDIRLGIKKNNNRGQFQFATASSPLGPTWSNHGSPFDEYNSSVLYTEIDLGSITFGSAATKGFRLTVTGKNSSSSGYNGVFDYIKLVPQ